jgi:hypothetical protein
MMNLKIGTIIVMDELLANFQISAPFSGRLHCRYAITVHVYQLAMNSGEEKVRFVNKNQTVLRTSKDRFSKSVVIGSSTYPMNDI